MRRTSSGSTTRGSAFRFGSPILACLALAGVSVARPAGAQAVYLTTRQALAEFFPDSERVTFFKVDITPERRDRLRRRLGYAPRRRSQTFYVGLTGERVDGYAIVDEERGLSLPITFAVLFGTDGRVRRMEILAYREPRGDEVRSPRFRRQFVGKGADDAMRHGEDIATVTGATVSSKAMARGVRRAVVMLRDLVIQERGAGPEPLSP